MLLHLQGYDMTIVYRLGKEMTLADGFSRLPNKKTWEEIKLDIRVNFVQFSMKKLTQIDQATNADSTLCELREMISRGWPDTLKEISKNLWPYWSYQNELKMWSY